MCFHTRAEYDAYVAARKKATEKSKAAGKHAKSQDKYGLIVLRDVVGEWVAGWHCDPRDPQDVANTIMDLKTWHAGEFRYVDTSDVDKERARLKLPTLDQDGLPLPNRAAKPSADDEIDEAFKAADMSRKLNILLNGVSDKTRKAVGALADAKEQAKLDAERAEKFAERQALAASLGLTMEELKAQEAAQASLRR